MRRTALLFLALVLCPALAFGAQITLKMGDNLPDRTSTWGAVVEQINAEFKAANPGLEIVTESYPDQPYQQKIKMYATAKQLPDVFKYWSFTSMLKPLVDGGFVAPLDRADYQKLGFMPGALEANTYGGKLYGLPVSADLWVIYYNKKLFKEAGVDKVPATLDELIALVPKFKAKGIIPMTTDGKDAWPLSITFDQLAWRISGDATLPQKALDRKIKFTEPVFVQAARELQRLAQSGLFQEDLMVSDYGAARNLFGQGKAAMYLMGSWELGLGAEAAFSDEFRASVDVFKFPTVAGGKGKADDLFAWFGGNYVVNASSKNAALGARYLQFYAQRFPVLAWEKQATLPAQKIAPRPSDTVVARALVKIASEAKATSGSACLDLSTPQFAGQIAIGDRDVTELAPKERDVAMVFQSYALYPHMTVRENLEFGLRIRKTAKDEIRHHVDEAARILDIACLLDRKPKELSGGQRQRVALGRAMVRHPSVFLFDEPLSNLDAKLRVQMRAEIKKLQDRLQTTSVYVTHDQIEAMTMGHRIAVMKDGKLQQVGTPLEVYERPANLFVANFIGTPPMNMVGATFAPGGTVLAASGFTLPVPAGARVIAASSPGRKVVVGIRPEALAGPDRSPPQGAVKLNVAVDMVETLGNESIVHGRIGDAALVFKLDPHRSPGVGEKLEVHVEPESFHLFDAGTGLRLPVEPERKGTTPSAVVSRGALLG